MLHTLALVAADTDLENSETVFELSPLGVSVLLGTILPLVTALVTKYQAPNWVKAVVNMFLSAVAAVVVANTVDGGGAVLSDETLVMAGITFASSVVSYWGGWRTIDINARIAPNVGIGGSTGGA